MTYLMSLNSHTWNYLRWVFSHAVSILTKVVCGGVKVLLWWGTGEGQSPAQAAVMYQHIQEDMWRHHPYHWVQRPDGQVGTILQRLPQSDNNTRV